jgi:hypothetical protein
MTVSSRPRLFSGFAPIALATAIAGLLATTGCEDKHIGRACDLTVDAGATGTGSSAIVNSEAVECPTRICLLPAADKTTTVGPLCTADCSSDDDCSDGESTHCKTGFTCMRPTTVGDFCCRALCVCKDFLDVPKGGYPLPTECKSGTSTCKNVH